MDRGPTPHYWGFATLAGNGRGKAPQPALRAGQSDGHRMQSDGPSPLARAPSRRERTGGPHPIAGALPHSPETDGAKPLSRRFAPACPRTLGHLAAVTLLASRTRPLRKVPSARSCGCSTGLLGVKPLASATGRRPKAGRLRGPVLRRARPCLARHFAMEVLFYAFIISF